MSSANRVRLAAIEESTYGETPGAGNFTQIKFTSENLTGTPQVVRENAIRADRQSGASVNTGLEMSGGFEFDLSADASIQLLLKHAMMQALTAASGTVADIQITTSTASTGTLTTTNDFTAQLADGDIVELSGFTNAVNNTLVRVDNVTTLTCDYVGIGLTNETAVAATVQRPGYHEVGTTEYSLSISKEFLDLDTGNVRNVAYLGERVSEMNLNFAYGQIVTGSFALVGAGYSTPTTPITDARTVDASGSDPALDASNGFGWLLMDGADLGVFVEELGIKLDNGMAPKNAIGYTSPVDQIPGSAAIELTAKIHLDEASFDKFMPAKIAQSNISIDFFTRDSNGAGYAVTLFSTQFNFPDPSSAGNDAQVVMEATGAASYDSTAGNTMRVYVF